MCRDWGAYYRQKALEDTKLQAPIEWAILTRDIIVCSCSASINMNIDHYQKSSPVAQRKFFLCLQMLALSLIRQFRGAEVDAIIGNDEHAFLEPFKTLSTLPHIEDNSHIIALFRLLLEAVGGLEDPNQHHFNASITPEENLQLCCVLFDIEGSNTPDNFDTWKMHNALSRGKVAGNRLKIAEIVELKRTSKRILGRKDVDTKSSR